MEVLFHIDSLAITVNMAWSFVIGAFVGEIYVIILYSMNIFKR